jgi:hypothetical protein
MPHTTGHLTSTDDDHSPHSRMVVALFLTQLILIY